MPIASFAELAAEPDPGLDELCLALAAEFRAVDVPAALAALDRLGDELAAAAARAQRTPEAQAHLCGEVLGRRLGFAGDPDRYEDPESSMLDLVLQRRTGLPILLSVVYVEAARRAGIPLVGVGLPGHFVVGHSGCAPPVLLDPFGGGGVLAEPAHPALVRAWSPQEVALRMLNNLLAAFGRRDDLYNALWAARLRLELPLGDGMREELERELRALQARVAR